PKYTRLGAQIVAAVIGASFVIGVQLAAILSYGTPSRFAFLQSAAVIRYAPDSGSTLWLPARAILGDVPALVVVFGISAIIFPATISIFAPRFGHFALATAGVSGRHRQLVRSGYWDAGEWQRALGFIANPYYRFRPRPEIFGSSKLYALRQ